MSDTLQPKAHADQRDYFRIDEEVLFEFKPISKSTPDDLDPEEIIEDPSGGLNLINQIKRIEKESAQTFKILSDKNRLLGDYFASLSKRIDLLARHVAFSNEESMKRRARTRISLSEDGIGFLAERPLYKGSFIAVRLIFLPNYEVVNTFARVVRCEAKDDNHQVAARFHQIADKDRQTISRHVLRSQVRTKNS